MGHRQIFKQQNETLNVKIDLKIRSWKIVKVTFLLIEQHLHV